MNNPKNVTLFLTNQQKATPNKQKQIRQKRSLMTHALSGNHVLGGITVDILACAVSVFSSCSSQTGGSVFCD